MKNFFFILTACLFAASAGFAEEMKHSTCIVDISYNVREGLGGKYPAYDILEAKKFHVVSGDDVSKVQMIRIGIESDKLVIEQFIINPRNYDSGMWVHARHYPLPENFLYLEWQELNKILVSLIPTCVEADVAFAQFNE